MRTTPLPRFGPDDVIAPWEILTRTIGERRAGSEQEHRAATYLADEFKSAGLAEVHLEPFECNSLRRAEATFEVRQGQSWKSVPCVVVVGSPSTRSVSRLMEMPLVWVEMPEQAALLKAGSMKGKALGIFGPLATNTEHHRAVVKTGAELVVWVDDRLPFEWAKADGTLPAWAKRHGVLPTVTVPYRMAYDWRLQGVSRIRASVFTEHVPSTSYNVIGDLPGEDEQLGSIVFGCHYDTQIGNVGADDNASGTVAVIALARAFAAAARERTFARSMRFIAFGTEEQLSVGSRAYCLAHRRQMKQHGLMVNFDSISSALGHTEMIVAGSVQMEEWMRGRLMRNGLAVRVSREVTPFSDHFPFTAFGVPAAWFCRPNFPGGRWQHHCVHDRPENCSLEVLCEIANAVGAVGAEVADAARLPFDGDFGPDQAPIIDRYARELYDMRSECMSAPASDGRGIGSPNPRT